MLVTEINSSSPSHEAAAAAETHCVLYDT